MKRVAQALDLVRATRSRIGKEEALAALLRSIPDDDGLALAARMATGMAMETSDRRTLGVGWALLFEVAEETTGVEGWLLRECARRVGELGEAFGLLLTRRGERPGLTLQEVSELFESLARTSRRERKKQLLLDAFTKTRYSAFVTGCTPAENGESSTRLGGFGASASRIESLPIMKRPPLTRATSGSSKRPRAWITSTAEAPSRALMLER